MQEIIDIAKEIAKIYSDLTRIECADKDDTYYLQTLETLKSKIKEENDLYKNLDEYEIEKLENYLKENYNNTYNARIIDKLNLLVSRKNSEDKISVACLSDIYNYQLTFLEEYINDDELKHLKDKLIQSKYQILYVSPNIEEEAIENNLEFSNNYSRAYLTAGICYKLPKIVSKPLINRIYISNLNMVLNELLKISDMEYSNDDNVLASIIYQTLIKSIICLISDDIMELVNNSINKKIDTVPNNISKNILLSILNSRDKDKEKIKIISLY